MDVRDKSHLEIKLRTRIASSYEYESIYRTPTVDIHISLTNQSNLSN